MKRAGLPLALALAAAAVAFGAGADSFRLPAFPSPAFAEANGRIEEMTSIRLLRELHRAGMSGFNGLETVDSEFAVLRRDSLDRLTSWVEATCTALDYDLPAARAKGYDGAVFARLLDVVTSLAALQDTRLPLAVPIGLVVCARAKSWGQLPADGRTDIYVLFATNDGMILYDPPTRQMSTLAAFPNKATVSQIRF